VKSLQLKVILARLPILLAGLFSSRFELHPLDCEAGELPLNQATA
jgi:hypothetical protein